MFCSKKHKCEKCGNEYGGSQFSTYADAEAYDNNEKPIILCKDCFDKLIENDKKNGPEKQEKEFKKQIKNLKNNVLEEDVIIEFSDAKILYNLEVEAYCKTKLTKEELKSLKESVKQSFIMSASTHPFEEGGSMYFEKKILPEEKLEDNKKEFSKEDFNQKPKKVIRSRITVKIIKKID